jgi:hypothetical protein
MRNSTSKPFHDRRAKIDDLYGVFCGFTSYISRVNSVTGSKVKVSNAFVMDRDTCSAP